MTTVPPQMGPTVGCSAPNSPTESTTRVSRKKRPCTAARAHTIANEGDALARRHFFAELQFHPVLSTAHGGNYRARPYFVFGFIVAIACLDDLLHCRQLQSFRQVEGQASCVLELYSGRLLAGSKRVRLGRALGAGCTHTQLLSPAVNFALVPAIFSKPLPTR